MVDALVRSKALAPQLRRAVVPRARLSDHLNRPDVALVLVSAPPGFGKTTLLASALADLPAAAWVSLDAGDTDPVRFWAYALLALDRAAPGVGTAALNLLDSATTPVEDVVVALVNELSVRTETVILVLDDYHLADSPAVAASVTFLLEHRPPQLHLVISTRADPRLPLPRLRARGELVELRAHDLRFSLDEAAAYLNRVHDLGLSQREVETLESRTEGWAAALQLAALSLHGRDDTAAFIDSFAGDDRFVMDYLVDEVLDRQPSERRRFLLQTSVLDRLSGPLCDAVTGDTDGQATLQILERLNLLLVPLDDARRWYRYHHLFADVLQARLIAEQPMDVAALHRRASDWFEADGNLEASVRHALAAGDQDRAADLIEVAAPALRRTRAEGTLRAWLEQLPADAVARRPVLASSFIGALMASNAYDGLAERLDALDATMAAPPQTLVIRDHAEWGRLPAVVATHRAALALIEGDNQAAIVHADVALQHATDGDRLSRASASAVKGLAAWAVGDLGTAHTAYTGATNGLIELGHVSDALGCTVTLVDLDLQRGHLDAARDSATRALQLAAATDGDVVRGESDMWVALAHVAWQRGDDAAAAAHLDHAAQLGEGAGLAQQPYRWRVAMAELREAQGNTRAAEELLDEAARLFNSDFSPHARPVEATRARLDLRTGHLDRARAWAASSGVTVEDDPTYLREYEHLTLARLLLTEHSSNDDPTMLLQATSLLTRLHRAAAAGGRIAAELEASLLLAAASDAGGRTGEAATWLERAVEIASPRAWLRPLVATDDRVRQMLTHLRGRHAGFVRAVATVGPSAPWTHPPTRAGVTIPSESTAALVAPLSSRERDVLRLLASDLDGPAIARHLHVSLPTVRTHTQRIYTKLGVNNRRAAVRRGHQLGL